MDYPTAWAIVNATKPEQHNPQCSFAQTSGALLCDCHVLTRHPQCVADYGTDLHDRCCGCAGSYCCNCGEAPCSSS